MFKSDTSKFKVWKILYDYDGFVVAEGEWHEEGGSVVRAIGCRWAGGDNNIGYPQTYGKPQWMIVPEHLGDVWKFALAIPK